MTFEKGDIVFITMAGQDFLSRNRGDEFNINVYGRLARIDKVYDWDTPEGEKILEGRAKHFTWSKLDKEQFKYVVHIFCPDLNDPSSGSRGVLFPEIMAEYHPIAKDMRMMEKWPGSFLVHAFSDNRDFKLVEKNPVYEEESGKKAALPKKKKKNRKS